MKINAYLCATIFLQLAKIKEIADALEMFAPLPLQEGYDNAGYIIDTHTAVAAKVYKKYVAATGDTTPVVIASTASPYKFTRSVMNAIDPAYDSKGDFELVDELCRLSGVKVPQAMEDIRTAPILHDTVCETEDMKKEVEKILGL